MLFLSLQEYVYCDLTMAIVIVLAWHMHYAVFSLQIWINMLTAAAWRCGLALYGAVTGLCCVGNSNAESDLFVQADHGCKVLRILSCRPWSVQPGLRHACVSGRAVTDARQQCVLSTSRRGLTGVAADLIPLSSSSTCSRRSLSSDIRLYVSCSAFFASALTASDRQQLLAAGTDLCTIGHI